MTVTKIISGGQTGVDRGALDAAKVLGLQRGGTAPKGWLAEDGTVPMEYRADMREAIRAGYSVRTRINVADADGTLILSRSATLAGGTLATVRDTKELRKPLHIINIDREFMDLQQRDEFRKWVSVANICTLNVAGPRESKAPGIQEQSRLVLVWLLSDLTAHIE